MIYYTTPWDKIYGHVIQALLVEAATTTVIFNTVTIGSLSQF